VNKYSYLRHLQFLLCLPLRIALDGLAIPLLQIEVLMMAEVGVSAAAPFEILGHLDGRAPAAKRTFRLGLS
jgi:hypothetical protein